MQHPIFMDKRRGGPAYCTGRLLQAHGVQIYDLAPRLLQQLWTNGAQTSAKR